MFGSKQSASPVAFALGKIGGHPEFLRALDNASSAIDGWLDAGWQAAHGRHGAHWDGAFGQGSRFGFLWSHGSKSQEATCGVIAPSADSVGRAYPLVIASRIPASWVVKQWPALPLAAEPLFDDACALVAESRSSRMGVDDLGDRILRLSSPSESEIEVAARDHAAWAARTRVEEVWGAIFYGRDRPLERAGGAIDALAEAVSPWVGQEWPSANLIVRLPIGYGGVAAAVVWLDLVRTLTRWRLTVPTVFWGEDADAVLLTVGTPAPVLLSELWQADAHDERIFDVAASVTEGGDGAARRFMAAHPDATMSDLESIFT